MNITLENQTFEMDGDGFMTEPNRWTKALAEAIAKTDGIETLTENHWKVIDIIRRNYEEKGMAPMVRVICKETGLKLKEIYRIILTLQSRLKHMK